MLTDAAEFSSRLDSLVDPVLWVVTARHGAEQGGLIATFVQKASLVPEMPRMAVAIAKHHHTWHLIENSRAFALHLFSEQHLEWVDRFGLHRGGTSDKLAGLRTVAGSTGSPLLEDAIVWLDCRVEATLDTGDRTLYLGEVVNVGGGNDEVPLRLKRMLDLLPQPRRTELKTRTAHDVALDAAAISAWRGEKRPPLGA